MQNQSIMLLIDPLDGAIVSANPAASKFYGYTIEEMVQMKISDINLLSHEEVMDRIRSVLEQKNNHFYFKHHLKSGEVRDVEVYTGRIILEGKPILYSVVHDISSQAHMKEELIAAKEKAEESDRLKSAFLANMSHEIRTPMNGILGFAQFLGETDLSFSKRKEFADIIIKSGKHLLRLLNDIIDIAKIDANKMKVNLAPVFLYSTMQDLFLFFQSDVRARGMEEVEVKMNFQLDRGNCTLLTDVTRLQQILTNLLGNAVKFTSKGQIELGCRMADEQTILFHVKDTGIGIPSGELEHIFDRFRQADLSLERKYGGTGLGLAISKACCELLGGRIWVESEVGKGSCFYFTLPFQPEEEQMEDEKEEDNLVLQYPHRKVLVVEDDDVSYSFLKELLTPSEISILRAYNGKEAVEFCQTHQDIDLVLMDIQLPGMNGYEATSRIRKIHPNLPIIAQTANAFSSDRSSSLEAGCNHFLSKPLDVSELCKLLDRYLAN